ncbi:MAG TPA: transglycosylase family protein [Nitrospira sp.]|nr:transglycosylase family protein [Nitrospira sp.]
MRKPYVSQTSLASYALAVGLAVVVTAAGFLSTVGSHVVKLHKASYRSTEATLTVAPKWRAVRPLRIAVAMKYLVHPGDTLSSIAKKMYGSSSSWPSLWWINKATVHNPNEISVGQELRLSGWHPQEGWIYTAAMRAVPVTIRVTTASFDTPSYSAASASAHRASSPVYIGGGYPGGAFGQCVVARESGGNAQVMNASGHYGLYQFSESTWVAYGGSAADFGHASVGEQERVFMNAIAQGGQSNWSAYDGC